jgi:hypothetical protein
MALQSFVYRSAARAPESDPELDAYNAVFDALGLDWQWDPAVWSELRQIAGDRERVCAYLRRWHPHLLTAYDAEFLGDAIVEAKLRHAADGAARGRAAALWHDGRKRFATARV